MGGSAAEAPTSPDAQPARGLRASDAERDQVVAQLGEEFAIGRLSQDTFLYRVSKVLRARYRADLPPLVADLPARQARRPVPLRFPRGAGTFFSIGRDAGCDLAIADMTVSRVHARLERTPDGWLLTDLASTNGTRVNGWRVRGRVQVRAGDLVSFGDAEYTLCAADGV